VIPLYRHGNSLAVVISDPSDLNTIDTLNHLLNADLEIKVARGGDRGRPEQVLWQRRQPDGQNHPGHHRRRGGGGRPRRGAEETARWWTRTPRSSQLVTSSSVDAYRARPRTIHLEPMPKRFRVRYRIDGVLHEVRAAQAPPAFHHQPPQDPVHMSIAKSAFRRRRIQTSVGAN